MANLIETPLTGKQKLSFSSKSIFLELDKAYPSLIPAAPKDFENVLTIITLS